MCQDKDKDYHVCKIISNYYYNDGSQGEEHHRRKVKWLGKKISKTEMTKDLQKSLTAQNTLIDISKYEDELQQLLNGIGESSVISNDPSIEEPSEFALEKHLEDFLVNNWSSTTLGV